MSTNLVNLAFGSTGTSETGIDVTAVVNAILDAQRGPEKLWKQQQDTLTLQNNSWNTINSALRTLEDAVSPLNDVLGVLTANTATSSNTGVLTATATQAAANGSHTVVVSNLATTGSYYTDAITEDSVLSSGTIHVAVGNNPAVDIPIDAAHTTTTLDGVATYVNSQKLGFSASVIHDVNGERLALTSSSTGVASDLTVSTDVPELKWNKIAAQNASLTVDGVPVSSASNSVTGVLEGVTLNLLNGSEGKAIQLTVGPDIIGMKQSINGFVDAYNTAIKLVNAQYVFDPTANASGPLASDSTLRHLQSELLSDTSYALKAESGVLSLGSLGITMNNDGTLTVDDDTLSEVLASNLAGVQNFFQSSDPNNPGFAVRFGQDLNDLTDPTKSMILLDQKGISDTQSMLTDQINELEERLTAQQKVLTDQYSKVDAALRQLPVLMQQVQSQLAALSAMYQG